MVIEMTLKLVAPIETQVPVSLRLFALMKEEFQIGKGTIPLSK